MILEMLGTIKIELIALFDERYVVVSSIVAITSTFVLTAVASPRDKEIPYRELNNTKPPKFDGSMDPIVAKRWISDLEGCYYTCACPTNLKLRYTYNLLHLGAND